NHLVHVSDAAAFSVAAPQRSPGKPASSSRKAGRIGARNKKSVPLGRVSPVPAWSNESVAGLPAFVPVSSGMVEEAYFKACTSTEYTAGKSRTIGDHESPPSADSYTRPPV